MNTLGPVVAIVGPTAVGKTDIAVALAQRHGGEIVSADSMAVYRGADIGTAKPTPAQRRAVPCHLIDVVEPSETFDVAEYRRMATEAIEAIKQRGRLPFVVGGTGLYVRALLDGLGLTSVPANSAVRAELWQVARLQGSSTLHAQLAAVDPVTASRLHPNDTVRIVRALEVWKCTGEPLSVWIERDQQQRRPVASVRIGLSVAMDVLDRRIDARVDAMMASGLLDEVRALMSRGARPAAGIMRGLGYRELGDHLMGTSSLAEAVTAIKRNTRRFARRQRTWFRGDPSVQWLDITGLSLDEAADRVSAKIQPREKGMKNNG